MKQNKEILDKLNKIFERAMTNYKYEWGIKKIEKLLRNRPNFINEDILCKLGVLYDHFALNQKPGFKKKYENKAIKLYQQALRINPKSSRAIWGIGRVWLHRQNKRAIPYALKAYHLKKATKKDIGLYGQHIGLIYEALGDYKKAEYWLLKGMRESRKNFRSYLNLVIFYRFIKKFDKAKKYAYYAERLYEKEPNDFKKTKDGKKIKEFILNADKPLPKIKKG